jgi:S-adenosylmethionine/arginine decarboxylase-like enzyme
MRHTVKRKRGFSSDVKTSPWGYHLIINAGDCHAKALRSKETIRKFSKDLVSKIGMVAYGKPQIVMFGTGNKKGYTLVQLIETSNISGHFVEQTNDIYLDIFSCKKFNPDDALEVFNEYFQPQRISAQLVIRQA